MGHEKTGKKFWLVEPHPFSVWEAGPVSQRKRLAFCDSGTLRIHMHSWIQECKAVAVNNTQTNN